MIKKMKVEKEAQRIQVGIQPLMLMMRMIRAKKMLKKKYREQSRK